ncbi:MAG: hypothetical protein M3R16_03625 [Pseudomonadota bacterium]|nr:hypothetical protein [Pseudomonadota bacterium]
MTEVRKKPLNDNTAAALDEVVSVCRDQAMYLRESLDTYKSMSPVKLQEAMRDKLVKVERGIAYIESLLEVRQNKKAPTADSDGW